jgi:hypothetical protein
VNRITPFLHERGSDSEPQRLRSNAALAFLGCKPGAKGFIFADDGEPAIPTRIMRELIARDPRNREVIRPYLGGAELHDDPSLTPTRSIIYFGARDHAEAASFPDVLRLVEDRVKPLVQTARWWQFARPAAALYAKCKDMERVLAVAEVSDSFAFAFLRPNIVFSNKLVLFALDAWDAFATLQSRVHEAWCRLLSSTMKDDLSYVPADAFETFPRPRELSDALEAVGETYYEFRAALMVKSDEGLTKTYNRFHDPAGRSSEVQKLRDLHAQMDRAVLDAYGWTDIVPVYDFREQLDKRIRLTWGEDTHDEVLARLLEVNRVRAAEEGAAAPKQKGAGSGGKKATKKGDGSASLFGEDE